MPITPNGSFIASVTNFFGRRAHRAVVFVGEGGVEEQPADRGLDLRRLRRAPVMALEPRGELGRAGGEVLGDVVEHLRAVVRRRAAPSRVALRGGLDRVADVLAIAHPAWPSALPWRSSTA